ncbi:hypothetical protein M406DRAFT_326495 [Cryphonectria parasitica EP155]|uniref:Uncharacterized protein n=1 Tax=Cryphonectria parasitica (strain ATCC 38755 / EP155) TaxID=660469 RepID=A0A9P5CVG6_CRYP1|nr:uncharacterized protein M406DRAFT_326495 [Cryphonectria parasitica EP155]KAF3771096.1 hypothetical protein M406DRAFT_326495 [Cryphonectria parasitica EP155]
MSTSAPAGKRQASTEPETNSLAKRRPGLPSHEEESSKKCPVLLCLYERGDSSQQDVEALFLDIPAGPSAQHVPSSDEGSQPDSNEEVDDDNNSGASSGRDRPKGVSKEMMILMNKFEKTSAFRFNLPDFSRPAPVFLRGTSMVERKAFARLLECPVQRLVDLDYAKMVASVHRRYYVKAIALLIKEVGDNNEVCADCQENEFCRNTCTTLPPETACLQEVNQVVNGRCCNVFLRQYTKANQTSMTQDSDDSTMTTPNTSTYASQPQDEQHDNEMAAAYSASVLSSPHQQQQQTRPIPQVNSISDLPHDRKKFARRVLKALEIADDDRRKKKHNGSQVPILPYGPRDKLAAEIDNAVYASADSFRHYEQDIDTLSECIRYNNELLGGLVTNAITPASMLLMAPVQLRKWKPHDERATLVAQNDPGSAPGFPMTTLGPVYPTPDTTAFMVKQRGQSQSASSRYAQPRNPASQPGNNTAVASSSRTAAQPYAPANDTAVASSSRTAKPAFLPANDTAVASSYHAPAPRFLPVDDTAPASSSRAAEKAPMVQYQVQGTRSSDATSGGRSVNALARVKNQVNSLTNEFDNLSQWDRSHFRFRMKGIFSGPELPDDLDQQFSRLSVAFYDLSEEEKKRARDHALEKLKQIRD